MRETQETIISVNLNTSETLTKAMFSLDRLGYSPFVVGKDSNPGHNYTTRQVGLDLPHHSNLV